MARKLEAQARAERKNVSGVIQGLWQARWRRLRNELHQMQTYWSRKAKEKGILSERDLERYLGK